MVRVVAGRRRVSTGMATRSELDLRADRDRALARQSEVVPWLGRDQPGGEEEALPPAAHSRSVAGLELELGEVEGRVACIDLGLHAGPRDLPHQAWHVVVLGVAVLGPDEGDPVVLVAQILYFESVLLVDSRARQALQRQDDRVLLQRMQVVYAGAHRQRRRLLAPAHEHAGPGCPDQWWIQP